LQFLRQLDSTEFTDFITQNLTIDELKKGFSETEIDFLNKKTPLWRELRPVLDSANISRKMITNSKGVLVQGHEITSLIFGEAIEYFLRAFYNFYAQDELVQKGYKTWSSITNYYSSFFGIHSLLRLQGRSITRIWRPLGKQFHVFPYDFSDHKYVICTNGVHGKSSHSASWSIYYDVYDGFVYPKNLNFESIYKKKNVGTVEEEMDFRNKVNYEPYQGYEEIKDPSQITSLIDEYINKDFVEKDTEILSSLTTDPYYKYYARSVLRIIFSYELLNDLAEETSELESCFNQKGKIIKEFSEAVKPSTENKMICQRLLVLFGLKG